MKNLTGKGMLYLTSGRLVFVHKDFNNDHFKSFDIPLALMYKLDFKQPIFGSNYLETYCKPLYNMIPHDAYIKIWFTEGGCDKFLRIFDVARKQVVTQLKNGKHYHDNTYNQQIQNGYFGGQAYHDPNDPTRIYTTQPQETFNNTPNHLGDNYYQQNQVAQAGQNPQMPNQQPQYPQNPQMQEQQQQQQQGNYNYPDAPQQNTQFPGQGVTLGGGNMVPNQQTPQGGMYNYPSQVPDEQMQPMPMGQPMNPGPTQPYTVGMNNAPMYNVNQPGIGYYFGVPIGPTIQRNN